MLEQRTSETGDETPRNSGELKRAQIPVRTTARARERLTEAARENGRSVTQEIEQRLERSLMMDELRGGPQTARLVEAIASDIARLEEWTGEQWHVDYTTFVAMQEMVTRTVNRFAVRPPNWDEVVAIGREWDAVKSEVRELTDHLSALGAIPSTNGIARLAAIGTTRPRSGMFGRAVPSEVAPDASEKPLGGLLAKYLPQLTAAAAPASEPRDSYDEDIAFVRGDEYRAPNGEPIDEQTKKLLAEQINRLRELTQQDLQLAARMDAALTPEREARSRAKQIAEERRVDQVAALVGQEA